MREMKNAIDTTHKLDFLSAEWPLNRDWLLYKVGTVHGQWRYAGDCFEILSFMNARFKQHLITKRGFLDIGNDSVENKY